MSFALVLGLSAYACGDDDDDGGTPDAGGGDGVIDAAQGGPDASGIANPTVEDNDGGWILFEYIHYSDGFADFRKLPQGMTVNRNMAHFYSSKNPQRDEFPAPPLNECRNLYETNGWPLGREAERQDATYVDVGDLTITGKNEADEDVTIDIPKGDPKVPDDWSQPQDIYYQSFNVPAGSVIKPDSEFTINMSGSADYPETTYENLAYMPAELELTDPVLNDDTFQLSTENATTRITWNYTPAPNQPDSVPVLLTAVVLGDTNGRPVMFCVTTADQGYYDFKGEDIAAFRSAVGAEDGVPAPGYMLRNSIAHTIAWFNNGDGDLPYDPANKRRIDAINVDCYVQLIQAVDTPLD
jgi:hypothetical protein